MERNFSIERNHIIIHEEGLNVIVDTGAPYSISQEGGIFLGHRIPGGQQLKETIRKAVDCLHLKTRVDALVGTPILSKHTFLFSKSSSIVQVDEPIPEEKWKTLELKEANGYFLCIAEENGRQLSMIFDTGASISYINELYTAGKTSQGTIHDYNPTIGDIKTESYLMDLKGFGLVEMGKITPKLQQYISQFPINTRCDGILGICSLSWEKCCLDLQNRRVLLV